MLYSVVDAAVVSQVQKRVSDKFSFLYPCNLCKMYDQELQKAGNNLVKKYVNDLSPNISSELVSFRSSFKDDVTKKASVIDILQKLVDSQLGSSLSELSTACGLFFTIPVTVYKIMIN